MPCTPTTRTLPAAPSRSTAISPCVSRSPTLRTRSRWATSLRWRPAVRAADARQLFSYTPNLELAIVCRRTALGHCVSRAPQRCTRCPRFRPVRSMGCRPPVPTRSVRRYGATTTRASSRPAIRPTQGLCSNICLNLYTGATPTSIASLAAGDFVDIDTCGAQMVPTAKVGAGAAGTSLRPFQMTNYQYFRPVHRHHEPERACNVADRLPVQAGPERREPDLEPDVLHRRKRR